MIRAEKEHINPVLIGIASHQRKKAVFSSRQSSGTVRDKSVISSWF